MPLQRRLPKRGFVSLTRDDTVEVRLSALQDIDSAMIDLEVLKASGVVRRDALAAKIILAGTIERAVTVSGVRVTKGAKVAIEAAGGSIVVAA